MFQKHFYILFFIGLLLSCRGEHGPKTIILAHNMPTSHPIHKGIEVFAEEVAKLSDQKLKVKIFPDSQLGSEREVLELLQIGSIAMTKVSAAAMANFAPAYQVLSVPYLFRDKKHLFEVLEGEVGKTILEGGSEYLLKGLCFYDAGSRSFYTTKKQIKEPKDLEGLKIRVMNHRMSVDMVNAMGGSATPMSYGELYTALQQGVVDGAENNPPSFVTSRHYEVCKYYTLDEHNSIPDVLIVGSRFWDTLSPSDQAIVEQAAAVSSKAQQVFWKENVDKCIETLKEAKVEIYRPDKQLFVESTSSIIAEVKKKPELANLIEDIQKEGK